MNNIETIQQKQNNAAAKRAASSNTPEARRKQIMQQLQESERAQRNAADDADDPFPHLALRSAQTLDAEGQARLARLLRWREVQARRSDKPKSWVLDNELAVALSRRPPRSLSEFHATLDRHPKAPRKSLSADHGVWVGCGAINRQLRCCLPVHCAKAAFAFQLKAASFRRVFAKIESYILSLPQ
mgnify:CR=1 FL=1